MTQLKTATVPAPETVKLDQILESLSKIEAHLFKKDDKEDPYLASEVCKILKTTRRTLDSRIKNGIIKAVRYGNTAYIQRAELRRYLSSASNS